ncbi:hypothetical protein C8R14_10925 [Nitrosomonas eutropha]|uniref:Uncharacterized protein n=1 Tax=Nitrosomonas eutropha TaxID=916 RepID=A0ABX5M7P1_9PROT|nr:hypothetical protein C8R14_10925 [Nitrosomonas eutropha]SEI81375.1 hypothetical protein SAMN05216318_11216 [Nitrosomonas eutropha]
MVPVATAWTTAAAELDEITDYPKLIVREPLHGSSMSRVAGKIAMIAGHAAAGHSHPTKPSPGAQHGECAILLQPAWESGFSGF